MSNPPIPNAHTGTRSTSLDEALAHDLDVLRRAGLLRALPTIGRRDGARITVDGRDLVDFASNDYLGLATHARLAHAIVHALPATGVGAGAARSIAGNHPLHEELERELARRKHAEAALLFPSGFSANAGVIPALVGRGDVIYSDTLNHASIIDGCRLSRATVRAFEHCDAGALAEMLASERRAYRRCLIVVEGVYSMDGDLCPLGPLVELAREHEAWLYVDDAHATGVLGATGAGSAEHAGVEGTVDITMGTLGKALGCAGAFVAGSATLREFLLNRARTFVFTTGSPPALAAAALAALRLLDAEPWRRERLLANAARLRERLAPMGITAAPGAPGHIVPIRLGAAGRAVQAGRALRERGFLVGVVRPPTVPMGSARLRVTLSARHTEEQIDRLADALRAVIDATQGGEAA
ncbi:MAG TPA: 8-amino-7-oxononanoate synthase [Gemmatimonadaceae bacterium]